MDNNIPTQEGITLRVLLSRLLNCQPMRVSKKYSGEAWATHGKRPYTPARYEAVPSQPDAAELGRLEGAFHRSLRPGAQLTTSLLGTSGLPTPVGACVEISTPSSRHSYGDNIASRACGA